MALLNCLPIGAVQQRRVIYVSGHAGQEDKWVNPSESNRHWFILMKLASFRYWEGFLSCVCLLFSPPFAEE